MTTLTSSVGIPPANDVRTDGVLKSGVSVNSADEHAANGTGSSSEAAKVQRENERPVESVSVEENVKENEKPVSGTGASSKGKEKAVEDGEGIAGPSNPEDTVPFTPRTQDEALEIAYKDMVAASKQVQAKNIWAYERPPTD